MSGAVDDIADRMQCPPDFPAAAMLVALASVVGCQIGIRPRRRDDWLVVSNLWGCVIGRPSLKKSPAIQTAEKRIREIEALDRERLADDIRKASAEAMVNDELVKVLRNKMSKSLKADDVDTARHIACEIQAMDESVAPVPRRIITTDPTIENLWGIC